MMISVFGGGQLARMLALAGIPLGHRFRFLDPTPDPPASRLGEHIRASFDDVTALKHLATGADVVTYEFENVPHRSVRTVSAVTSVHPTPDCLEIMQERLAEKKLFILLDIPTPRFSAIDTPEDVTGALESVGLPCMVKTRRSGYDGKGQRVVRTMADAEDLWLAMGGVALIVEEFVSFSREVSLLSVRDVAGNIVHYPLTESVHEGGILRCSKAPISSALQAEAERYATAVLTNFGYVGVLCIEFFECDGRLLANEMAPRVHNSGHWTIEGAECSQFENHIRAITGMPLGSVTMMAPVMMLNMIGVYPDLTSLLREPGAHVHLYDKSPAPGRKIGHVTLRGETAWDRATKLRRSCEWPQA